MKISLVFAFLFLPLSAFAQSVLINEIAWPVNVAYATNGLKMGTVIINEVAWMGSPVGGIDPKQWWRYEWLELYNNADTAGMLDGWNVELYREKELYFKIPLLGTVAPHGYFLIGASDKIQGVDVNYANLGGKFLNTGQKIVLSNAVGVVVDEVDATLSWSAGDNATKQTMERVVGSDPTTWQTSAEAGGTPKDPNSAGIPVEPVKLSSAKLSSVKESLTELRMTKEKTEKDLPAVATALQAGLLGSSSQELQSFQGRVPIINPITLLAGLLALGFSGVLLAVKRLLALRQSRRT